MNIFKTLPQKLYEPHFLWIIGRLRKPSSQGNFPLPGILSFFGIVLSVYIYIIKLPGSLTVVYNTTVILPGTIASSVTFQNSALVSNTNLFKTLPQKLSEPRFSKL